MSEILLGVLRMSPALFWDDNPLTRFQHDNIRREAADEIERLQSELARELQRRFDGNEQASREHRAEVKALLEPVVMVPYLKTRADAVDGHYCIARLHPRGYHEFWNEEQKEWCSAGSVFELGKVP